MKRIALVTGAGGAIGATLVRRLLKRDYAVRALLREPASATPLPDGIEVVRCDINDCQLVRLAVVGADVIFHLAAKLHINNPSPRLKDEYFRVNVEGTRCLARAAHAAEVKLIFFSTINVYGSSQPGQLFDEETPFSPDSLYAETKIEGEEIVRAESRAVILRLAAVYGPRMKGNYTRLVEAIRRGRLPLIGDGRNRRTLVHVEDACDAAIAAAEHDAAVGQIYNVTDGSVHSLREIIRAIAVALEKRPPRLHLPTRPARFAAGLLEDGLRVVGKESPITRATIDKLTEDIAVSGEKIQRELGFQPRYDLQAGWRQTVEQMTSG
ncbi:MAG TPA: NAD-dependent epimerase/dehydratase family protein [Pyrinomonadaceae bacterium]|jgi:UDP-glucose 4-epimerase